MNVMLPNLTRLQPFAMQKRNAEVIHTKEYKSARHLERLQEDANITLHSIL